MDTLAWHNGIENTNVPSIFFVPTHVLPLLLSVISTQVVHFLELMDYIYKLLFSKIWYISVSSWLYTFYEFEQVHTGMYPLKMLEPTEPRYED